MAEGGDNRRAGARTRVRAWPLGGSGARVPDLSDRWRDLTTPLADAAGARLRNWIATDVAPGRLIPWVPVSFGLGVILYFTADREPSLWAGIIALVVALGTCFAARSRPVAMPVMLGIAFVAAGFTFATWRSVQVAHPILTAPAYNATLTGSSKSAKSASAMIASLCGFTP